MQAIEPNQVDVGLGGVVAATTRTSRVDGEAGSLLIAGEAVEDLAPVAGFEECLFLLWRDRRPEPHELAAFQAELAGYRAIPAAALNLLREAARAEMEAAAAAAAAEEGAQAPDGADTQAAQESEAGTKPEPDKA